MSFAIDSDLPRAWSVEQQKRLSEWDIPQSVDIHCHCLPGLDDGPKSTEQAIALCEALVADGITTVIATPHQLGRYDGDVTAARIRLAIAALQVEVDSRSIPLEIVPGADVRIDERIFTLLDNDTILTAGPFGRHLLLELPHELYVNPVPIIVALGTRGIQTILTHPERHSFLAGSTRRLKDWITVGAALQVTAGSLLGDFGPLAREESWRMAQAGMISLIATDAHDVVARPPRLTAALEQLTQQFGRGFARVVCLENPLRVLRGTAVQSCRPNT